MTTIQLFDGIPETVLPKIKLTKSKNGKTGTATFVFFNPKSVLIAKYESYPIQTISLLWNKNKNRIVSKDFRFIFVDGKPKALKVIFLFKNSKEWFEFFSFISSYSKQTGLSFSGKNSANY